MTFQIELHLVTRKGFLIIKSQIKIVWYRYSKNNLRKIIAQKLDDIFRMRELNKAVPQGLGEAKKRYIEQAIALDPGINKEELEELWGNYVSELRQYPSFSDAQYEDFDTWRSKNSPEQIEQMTQSLLLVYKKNLKSIQKKQILKLIKPENLKKKPETFITLKKI